MVVKIQRRSAHPPFPKPGRQGNKVDAMPGMRRQAFYKTLMGTTAKRFQKQYSQLSAPDFLFFFYHNAITMAITDGNAILTVLRVCYP